MLPRLLCQVTSSLVVPHIVQNLPAPIPYKNSFSQPGLSLVFGGIRPRWLPQLARPLGVTPAKAMRQTTLFRHTFLKIVLLGAVFSHLFSGLDLNSCTYIYLVLSYLALTCSKLLRPYSDELAVQPPTHICPRSKRNNSQPSKSTVWSSMQSRAPDLPGHVAHCTTGGPPTSSFRHHFFPLENHFGQRTHLPLPRAAISAAGCGRW